ncbi:MAG: glutamine synthetase adenylyltransferase [Thermoanaerobaculia bacterium]
MIKAVDGRCRELLIRGRLNDAEISERLSSVGIRDVRSAHAGLLRMGEDPQLSSFLSDLLPHLLETLTGAPDPEGVLVNLERFSRVATDRGALFRRLAENPRAVEILVTLFSGSQFLTEILLRNPEYFERLDDRKDLSVPKSAEQFLAEAAAAVCGTEDFAQKRNALRRLQRLELLRIGACDLLGLFDLATVTEQLSHLADGLVSVSLGIAAEETGGQTKGFAVVAMGKLGGEELNYSSDVDLLFLAAQDAGPYRRLGERLIEALSSVTSEGFLYRVDMRLRPWGHVGSLVSSTDGYLAYLERHARLWEKQALLKARVIAGDLDAGREFLRRAEPLLFGAPPEMTRREVHAMKQRTETLLRQQGREGREVKLGEGAIRDVEFVVQYLQQVHGAGQPAIRSRNTLDALGRLAAHGVLSGEDRRVLAEGYVFLRTIEHHLQMMHYRQTHMLPADADALAELARRLGFRGERAGRDFEIRFHQHASAIRAVYLRHLGEESPGALASPVPSPPSTGLRDHLARMDASYATTFGEEEIALHAVFAEQLGDDRLVEVDAQRVEDGLWRVTIVAFDYPGELSLICGLLFAFGFTIQHGDVFTYEPQATPARTATRRKIVDVFTVRPVRGEVPADVWVAYAKELADLLRLMHDGKEREARGELAKRAAASMPEATAVTTTLYPVEIGIDNASSDRYTVLTIDSHDTAGFLYELTNALALNGVYISRVTCESAGAGLHDILYVTDAEGRKITAPERQRILRAATVLTKHFTHLLPRSPNPQSALTHFSEFIGQLFTRPDWPNELASLERPKVLDAVARFLGVSDFLWNDFLRMQHTNLFPVIRNIDVLAAAKSKRQLKTELEAAFGEAGKGSGAGGSAEGWRQALNAFKDRELFRMDMRHILGHTDQFWKFSDELTDLSEVVVEAAVRRCEEELRVAFGAPELADGRHCPLSICAFGKFGGREPGLASDIELMFVYVGAGRTGGPHVITSAEFFEKLVQAVLGAIRAKREGVFELDLQLRPYGKAGSLAVSLDAFRHYFAPGGPAWAYERQALVKLRPIAGDVALGREIAAERDAIVYGGAILDVTAMRAMRERQIRHLVAGGTFNAKFSPGGLVDVEYLVQSLQIRHGAMNPRLRSTNTRDALSALAEASVLTPDDHARLRKAHAFLRWLIDALRVVRGHAKDVTVPPYDSEEFAFLARRLKYGNDVARLRDELAQYASSVQELSKRLLG